MIQIEDAVLQGIRMPRCPPSFGFDEQNGRAVRDSTAERTAAVSQDGA
jgi:hypothetical protein